MSTTTAEQIVTAVSTIAVPVATVLAPGVGNATVEALIVLGAKYGPEYSLKLIKLLKKATDTGHATLADVEEAFAPLKAYEDYGIPEVAPTATATT